MSAKRLKFERYVLPPRRNGMRQRKSWSIVRELVDRVEQTAARRKCDESEIVMRAIETYLPDAEPKRGRKPATDATAGDESAAA